MFDESENPMELVVGGNFFERGRKRKMFDQVVGFAKFSEFLVVASVSFAPSSPHWWCEGMKTDECCVVEPERGKEFGVASFA